jgi:hypothetical protein
MTVSTAPAAPAVPTARNRGDAPAVDAVPQPIVALFQGANAGGILAGLLLRQPLLTTLLAAVLVPAVLLGPRANLYVLLGTRLFPRRVAAARAAGRVEDPRLVRFNNALALGLLLLVQGAFLLGAPAVGWALALAVAGAGAAGLAGFCLGCFLYYQLGLHRSRLLGPR